MSFITKSALRTGIALSVAVLGCFSFVSAAHAASLEVTSIENVRTSALPGSTFENGLSWKFNVTVPTDEIYVGIGISNLIDGEKVIAVVGNTQFSSAQVTLDQEGHTGSFPAGRAFSINPALDLNPSLDGTQIQIAVDVKLPATTTPGSYSFNYQIESEAPVIIDTEAPVIAPHATVIAEATGPTGATVTYSLPEVTDNKDFGLVATCNPASGSLFPVGNTTVNCSATDLSGNTANSSFVVTVNALPVDTTGPVFGAYPSDVFAEATSAAGANVTLTLPTAVDAVDGAREVTCSATSGSVFPIGNTNIACYATDIAGNISFLSIRIVVRDTTAPVITLNGAASQTLALNASYVELGATAVDVVDGSITPVTTSNVNTAAAGTYTVIYTATDSRNNISTATRTVIVEAAPTATYTITASAGSNGSITPAGVSTVVEGTSKTYAIVSSGRTYKIGSVVVDGVALPQALANRAPIMGQTPNPETDGPGGFDRTYSYTFSNVIANHTIEVTFINDYSASSLLGEIREARNLLNTLVITDEPNIGTNIINFTQSVFDQYSPAFITSINNAQAVYDNPASTRLDIFFANNELSLRFEDFAYRANPGVPAN